MLICDHIPQKWINFYNFITLRSWGIRFSEKHTFLTNYNLNYSKSDFMIIRYLRQHWVPLLIKSNTFARSLNFRSGHILNRGVIFDVFDFFGIKYDFEFMIYSVHCREHMLGFFHLYLEKKTLKHFFCFFETMLVYRNLTREEWVFYQIM